MNYINVVKINIPFIKHQIDLFHQRFNVNPVLICSQHTLQSLIEYCQIHRYDLYNITAEQVHTFADCRVFIDNALDYGLIDIR